MRVVAYVRSYGVGTIPAFAHDNIHIFSEKCKELGIRDNYVLNPSHFEKGQVKEIVNCILLLAFLGKNKNMESALPALSDEQYRQSSGGGIVSCVVLPRRAAFREGTFVGLCVCCVLCVDPIPEMPEESPVAEVKEESAIPEESPVAEVKEEPAEVKEEPTEVKEEKEETEKNEESEAPTEIKLESSISKEEPKTTDTQMYISLAALGCLILMTLFNFYSCLFHIYLICTSLLSSILLVLSEENTTRGANGRTIGLTGVELYSSG